ncbi:peptide-methionine (S)-S-oxide reductase [Gramella sp. ASW11-100T]|uniref:peptide-methionine (S)-S-oxide reductase n=1 Tax=Christiangramia sediminis TaxID=2881336 RepID=A0A9X1RTN8_9FLAO|nr:peptide-methionine (S)-S-oxide reductase [Christiangramia sediminis]
MKNIIKIGFGGGCHWCTEAVFQVLKGVEKVEQGYISTGNDPETFYEGVIVHYDSKKINLEVLIRIHLRTHKSNSEHSMRSKYLSAIYYFDNKLHSEAEKILTHLSEQKIEFITRLIPFGEFKTSREQIRNYYKTDPERPFCRRYIDPKLKIIQNDFVNYLK